MKKAFFRKKGIENSITLYILLFLACLNFIGRGPILFLLFCIWGLIKSIDVHIKWNVNAICYLLMSLAAIIASILFFDGKEIIKSFVYFLAFVVGYKGYLSSNNKNQFVKYSIFAAFAGFFCNVLITYYINFIVIGHTSGQRQLYSFWTNDLMSATLIGLMSSVLIAYSFYCIFCKQSVLYKVLGCIIVGLLSFVNLETSTRTPFVLIGIVYVFMLYELFSVR